EEREEELPDLALEPEEPWEPKEADATVEDRELAALEKLTDNPLELEELAGFVELLEEEPKEPSLKEAKQRKQLGGFFRSSTQMPSPPEAQKVSPPRMHSRPVQPLVEL